MNTMVQAAIQTSNEMQRHLVAKATEDAEFRAQLVTNPNAAIKQEFGIDLPEYVSIRERPPPRAAPERRCRAGI